MTCLLVLSTTALARALVPVQLARPNQGYSSWAHVAGAAR